jgi:hypothetical protein
MVTEPANDPAYWRQRAYDTRRMAEDMKDALAKETLKEIARSYESIADMATRNKIADGKTNLK